MAEPTLTLLGTAAIVVLLGCSAFFSSSETAIFSLSRAWIEQQAVAGGRRATTLRALHDNPHRLLVTLLVGNNVVNVAISSIVTLLLASYLQPGSTVLAATAVTSLVILVFGEIVPKSFGLSNAGRWALAVAGPIHTIELVLSPVVGLLDALTRRMSAALGTQTDIEAPYLD